MCPSDPLEFFLANFVYTIDDVFDIHLGIHLNIEDSLHAKIHGLIDWDTLVDRSTKVKRSQEHTFVFLSHDAMLKKIEKNIIG